MAAKYAKIAVSDVTYWVDRPYDYAIPQTMANSVQPGCRVIVPFGRSNRKSEGIVLNISEKCDYKSPKCISALMDDEPLLSQEELNMTIWMRERFFCTVYDAVKAILPTGLWYNSQGRRKAGDKMSEYAALNISGQEALELAGKKKSRAPMQAAVLELLAAVGEASFADIHDMTGAAKQTVKSLAESGVIGLTYKEEFRRPAFKAGAEAPLPQLNEEQGFAFEGLKRQLHAGTAGGALLLGVTGSGKTSVYIHLIREALDSGSSAILLVPEIALTPQMLETFSSYFGDDIAVIHSCLTIAERYDEWKRIRKGDAHLVIGTRSAVFAPVQSLGLIIIDEEQEESYKSENSPRYHARDVAKYRCGRTNSLLLLGSATPDIESRYAADTGRYSFYELKERFNQMPLPHVDIVDMKRELRAGNDSSISRLLREEIRNNIANNEQSILFINRRGASKLITCVDCGYNFKCPNCSVSLTYHSSNNRLMCHYCGYVQKVSECCPECGGELRYIGDGTQKVEEQLRELFPDTEILRFDTDTVAQAGSHDELLSRFREEHIPIMVGTQMVTKGLNFEGVTLVGVLSADQSLYCGDYRASERTFSLITQVIGRSGRARKPGRAIIQTYTPENQVIAFAAKQDYEGFYRREIELRRVQKCPPFTQVIAISVNGVDERMVLQCCRYIKSLLERELYGRANVNILGPAPYPVVRVNNRFRYKVSLACSAGRDVRALVSKILVYCNTEKEFRGLSVYADMNPLD